MPDLIPRDAAVRALVSSNGDYLDALERFEKIPAVDAITVEWLHKWPKDLREGAYVRDILQDWQKEQEART